MLNCLKYCVNHVYLPIKYTFALHHVIITFQEELFNMHALFIIILLYYTHTHIHIQKTHTLSIVLDLAFSDQLY